MSKGMNKTSPKSRVANPRTVRATMIGAAHKTKVSRLSEKARRLVATAVNGLTLAVYHQRHRDDAYRKREERDDGADDEPGCDEAAILAGEGRSGR